MRNLKYLLPAKFGRKLFDPLVPGFPTPEGNKLLQ
jgi:hypothetical protein